MKFLTWTLYEASNFTDVKSKTLIEGEVVLLVLKPDFIHKNTVLGLAIPKNKSATKVVDLQNKKLTSDEIYGIFAGNLGMVDASLIKNLEIGGNDFSSVPIRVENRENVVKVYNLFFKTDSLEFDTKDFEDLEKSKPQDIYNETDFKKLPMRLIMQNLQLGMDEYNKQMGVVNSLQEKDEERKEKIIKMSLLQANLIVLFDETLRRVDDILKEKDKVIAELQASKK